MRRGLGVLAVLGAALLPAASASAATLRICSGSVPSFDDAKLDVDLTQPMENTGSTHPLIVMLHGFGNDKHEWESTTDDGDGADKYHWNNRWFAKHGYYVLAYTARGFSDDGPSEDDNQPPTPGDSSGSIDPAQRATLHLKSRDYEAVRTAASKAGSRRARPRGRSRTSATGRCRS